MRTCIVSLMFVFFACFATRAAAQDTPRWELDAGYSYARTNAPPGGCGCVSMNGGNGGVAYHLNDHLALAGDVAVVTAGNVRGSGQSLSLLSYQVGPRVYLPMKRVTPFGQVLVGGAHASNPAFGGSGPSANAFAATVGGGIDLSLNRRFALRLIEADYIVTTFSNGVNDHQNNLRLSFGVVAHLGN
jgi:peptidoglycan-associated lipoprotein